MLTHGILHLSWREIASPAKHLTGTRRLDEACILDPHSQQVVDCTVPNRCHPHGIDQPAVLTSITASPEEEIAQPIGTGTDSLLCRMCRCHTSRTRTWSRGARATAPIWQTGQCRRQEGQTNRRNYKENVPIQIAPNRIHLPPQAIVMTADQTRETCSIPAPETSRPALAEVRRISFHIRRLKLPSRPRQQEPPVASSPTLPPRS